MIELAIPQRCRDLGGFEVGRVLPYARRRMVGPFIFFDRMGPVDLPAGLPRSVDVRPHPHIGLATLTYLFDGEIMHRDSVGSEQAIRPGDVNWMIAGRGITHSERFELARRDGDRLHGIQAWVALPDEDEECAPSFAHHPRATLPTFQRPDQRGRLIAGSAFGERSPVDVRSPLFYLHWQLDAGASLTLPDEYSERAVFIVSGTVEADDKQWPSGQMLLFAAGQPAQLRASEPCVLMLLGGEPVGERLIEWNFVASSQARIEQAKADWRAGRFALPLHDAQEFIPLPQAEAPPEPMS